MTKFLLNSWEIKMAKLMLMDVLDQALDRMHNSVKLALPKPYRLLYRQSGLGREVVMVKLLENDVTPWATYELAGEDPEGRRYCVRGEYCFTAKQAEHSLYKRTGTLLVVS